MTINEIKTELVAYASVIQDPIPTEINECIERLSYLASIQARTGSLIADATKIMRQVKDDKMKSYLLSIQNNFLSSKIQNSIIDGFVIEEMFIVESLNTLNVSVKIQMEICRTIISKEKEEMRFAGVQQSK